jgi:glycosyltransferase involved in cell wall biosynthesis
MTRELRILMLNNEYPPLGGGTGVVNQHILAEWAKRDDVIVDLVTSSMFEDDHACEELTPRIRLHRVPVDRQNIHHAGNRELLTYAWRALRLARQTLSLEDYDLCFAFSSVPAGGTAYALWRLHKLPYIVRMSGPDIPGFENRYQWLYPILTPVLRRIWTGAGAVIAKCKGERQQCQSVCCGLPVTTIANAVDVDLFEPSNAPRSPDQPVRILSVGRLIERKGQQHLIDATRLLCDRGQAGFEVVLAGTGDSEAALKAQVVQADLQDVVRFLGFVPREEMPNVYAAADVFVLPSFNEGMSVALLEAMASGLPVVVTPTGGTEELLDGNGCLVPWADAAALAETLGKLIGSPELRAVQGRRSRELALRHTWPNTAQAYLDLCRHVAAEGRY